MPSGDQITTFKKNAVIYVVDDDASFLSSLKRLLKSMEFEARTFISAWEFLRHGPLHDHGCVILDVRMPEMNGLDLQKRLSDSGVLLPVIFMTAYEDPGVHGRAMQAGALAFLRKPFDERTLLDGLYSALERSHRQRSGNGV